MLFTQIFSYDSEEAIIIDNQFEDRLDWNGSRNTPDLQDASIYILNVTFNDSGVYRCFLRRTLLYDAYDHDTTAIKLVHLTVVAKGGVFHINSAVNMQISQRNVIQLQSVVNNGNLYNGYLVYLNNGYLVYYLKCFPFFFAFNVDQGCLQFQMFVSVLVFKFGGGFSALGTRGKQSEKARGRNTNTVSMVCDGS